MRESTLQHDVHFLEKDSVTFNGVQFLGATMWTDFAYFSVHKIEVAMAEADRYMADYRDIEGCTPLATIDRHVESRLGLNANCLCPARQRIA